VIHSPCDVERPRSRRWLASGLALAAALFLTHSPAAANSKYAALVIDAHTGKELFSRNADAQRYPASLTKIMTVYILFDFIKQGRIKFTTPLVVTPFAAGQSPSKIGFKPGQSVAVIDAIKALCTKSANDVAVAVAENIAGTEENFARLMTQTARRLGMNSTTFRNASGLPHPGQVTTARDMVILGQRIQQDFPEYYSVFGTKNFSYRGKNFRNHNRLLSDYEGTDGIKTGYIRASGFNLTASVRRDGKHLIAVVMGGQSGASRNAHMKELLDQSWRKATRGGRREPLIASLLPWGKKSGGANAGAAAPVHTAAVAPDPALVAAGSEKPRKAVARPADLPEQNSFGAPSGGYHVQVGAYGSEGEAGRRLEQVRGVAGDLVDGHQPFTMHFKKGSTDYYRARFAGFSKASADSACATLKQKEIGCVVMLAE
jgi:D-alanyl-D-alanine carboxypeptidase